MTLPQTSHIEAFLQKGSYSDIHVQKLVQKYMHIRTNTWMFLTFVSFIKIDSL